MDKTQLNERLKFIMSLPALHEWWMRSTSDEVIALKAEANDIAKQLAVDPPYELSSKDTLMYLSDYKWKNLPEEDLKKRVEAETKRDIDIQNAKNEDLISPDISASQKEAIENYLDTWSEDSLNKIWDEALKTKYKELLSEWLVNKYYKEENKKDAEIPKTTEEINLEITPDKKVETPTQVTPYSPEYLKKQTKIVWWTVIQPPVTPIISWEEIKKIYTDKWLEANDAKVTEFLNQSKQFKNKEEFVNAVNQTIDKWIADRKKEVEPLLWESSLLEADKAIKESIKTQWSVTSLAETALMEKAKAKLWKDVTLEQAKKTYWEWGSRVAWEYNIEAIAKWIKGWSTSYRDDIILPNIAKALKNRNLTPDDLAWLSADKVKGFTWYWTTLSWEDIKRLWSILWNKTYMTLAEKEKEMDKRRAESKIKESKPWERVDIGWWVTIPKWEFWQESATWWVKKTREIPDVDETGKPRLNADWTPKMKTEEYLEPFKVWSTYENALKWLWDEKPKDDSEARAKESANLKKYEDYDLSIATNKWTKDRTDELDTKLWDLEYERGALTMTPEEKKTADEARRLDKEIKDRTKTKEATSFIQSPIRQAELNTSIASGKWTEYLEGLWLSQNAKLIKGIKQMKWVS